MEDPRVNAGEWGGKEDREPRWADQRIEPVFVTAAGAKPAAVLHRDRLIESERFEVAGLLLGGVLGVLRKLLLWAAWRSKDEGINQHA